MVNFREKMLSFRHLCYKNGYLFAAFLIPVILMGIAYISFGIYPFGGRSVLSLDLNAQYVFYFDYVHDVIGNGESLCTRGAEICRASLWHNRLLSCKPVQYTCMDIPTQYDNRRPAYNDARKVRCVRRHLCTFCT